MLLLVSSDRLERDLNELTSCIKTYLFQRQGLECHTQRLEHQEQQGCGQDAVSEQLDP